MSGQSPPPAPDRHSYALRYTVTFEVPWEPNDDAWPGASTVEEAAALETEWERIGQSSIMDIIGFVEDVSVRIEGVAS